MKKEETKSGWKCPVCETIYNPEIDFCAQCYEQNYMQRDLFDEMGFAKIDTAINLFFRRILHG